LIRHAQIAYVPCRPVVHNNGTHMSYMWIDPSKFGKDDNDMNMLVKNGSRSWASSISNDRTNGIITITWQWLWRFRLVTIESDSLNKYVRYVCHSSSYITAIKEITSVSSHDSDCNMFRMRKPELYMEASKLRLCQDQE
jgi:hypothetical protein